MQEDDIIQEILLRLPVKSLVRCKSLSKDWMDFISHNPAFRRRFIDRNKGCSFMLGFYITLHSEFVGLVDEKVRFLPTYNRGISVLNKRKSDNNDLASLHLYHPPEKEQRSSPAFLLKKTSPSFFSDSALRVLASSNGFLLCSLDEKCPLNYIIINPINKLCMSLPVASASSDDYTHGFICCSTSPQLDTVDYYKVVRGISPEDWGEESFTTLEIISSDSSQWSQFYVRGQSPFYLDSLNPSKIVISKRGLVYVPGIVCKEEEETTAWVSSNNNGVLVFDQSKQESVHVVELPAEENQASYAFLGESDGLISYARNEQGYLKIWRYDEQESGGWSLVHNVSLESWVYYLTNSTGSATAFIPGAFHPTDKNVIFLRCNRGQMVYDLKKSKMECFCDMETEGLESVYYFYPYTCGLVGTHLFLPRD